MVNQTITQLPTPPSTTDVVNFNDRADNFLAAMPTFVTQTNTVIEQINSTETNINSKESSATSAASTATIQAGIATTKASEANASATAAYNAQLAAEAVFDSFDDKYLGAKATAPTVDNDGNTLVTGALYFRTTAPKGIYVYDAELSAWSIFSYIPTSHGTLSGRSDADSHPMSAITGLVEALADKLSKTLDASIDGIKTFLKSPKIRSSDSTHFVTLSYSGTSDKTVDFNSIVPDATNLVKGIDYKSLLAEYAVTGSAVTSVDITGIDINTHKSYRIEIEIIANGGGNIYLFANGDTTIANYYSQLIGGNNNAFVSGRNNEPRIANVNTGDYQKITLELSLIGGKFLFNAIGNYSDDSGIQSLISVGSKIATISNLTQITISSSSPRSIGVGTKIHIYRGDV